MGYVKLDTSNVSPLVKNDELLKLQKDVNLFHNKIKNRSSPGHDSLGWMDHPVEYDYEEFERIKQAAIKVRKDSSILLVIGIGGSYMGARAAIEMLNHSFYNDLSTERRNSPKIYFVGQNLSSTYMLDLIELLHGKEFSINVISKSGTTIEPAIAFRIFRKLLVERYGEEQSKSRIYVTTDEVKGSLRTVATIEGYETFVIPKDIGGRFSVLTAVGLFPIAVSGISIDQIMNGAAVARMELNNQDLTENEAYKYAALRTSLYRKGKTTEILVSYEPSFHYFSEWWKQLYAESEGKDGKGIFPTTAIYSTDLHSIGQYIQEGRRNLFETIVKVEKSGKELMIKKELYDFDNLNYLSGKTVNFVNDQAYKATLQAHSDGGIPNIIIQVPEKNPFTFGYLIYFFQKSCVMSGYLLGVNPFNQLGVNAYKKNLFQRLGRLEYEKEIIEVN